VCDDAKLQVTKQCKIRFIITANFFHEVELDVVPIEIFVIVLGSPYLFDRKIFFYREDNKYHLLKDGIEYIFIYHRIKTNVSLVSIENEETHEHKQIFCSHDSEIERRRYKK
jgi:hypothetical protein